MAAWSSTTERNTPRFSRRLVSVAKKVSTALSQEHEVGVKWKTKRGWRARSIREWGWTSQRRAEEHGTSGHSPPCGTPRDRARARQAANLVVDEASRNAAFKRIVKAALAGAR